MSYDYYGDKELVRRLALLGLWEQAVIVMNIRDIYFTQLGSAVEARYYLPGSPYGIFYERWEIDEE